MPDQSLTILNRYDLLGPVSGFEAAISALAARVKRDGHPGVLSYWFFASEAEGAARAVIDYADAAAWIGHHDIAMDWPEMKALHAKARQVEILFLGQMTDEIRTWIAGSRIMATVSEGNAYIAGFRR